MSFLRACLNNTHNGSRSTVGLFILVGRLARSMLTTTTNSPLVVFAIAHPSTLSQPPLSACGTSPPPAAHASTHTFAHTSTAPAHQQQARKQICQFFQKGFFQSFGQVTQETNRYVCVRTTDEHKGGAPPRSTQRELHFFSHAHEPT